MKEFYTVVLDRLKEIDCTYSSEPYEAGWADEAIAFIRVHKIEEGKRLSAKIEISPDGIEYNSIEEAAIAAKVHRTTMVKWVNHFPQKGWRKK